MASLGLDYLVVGVVHIGGRLIMGTVSQGTPRNNLRGVLKELDEVDRTFLIDCHAFRGKIILSRCYEGSEDCFHSSKGKNSDSIRRMSTMRECRYKKTSMTNWVHLYLLLGRAPALRQLRELNYTHFTKVLSLSFEDQILFLELAAKNKWSTHRLQAYVSCERGEGEERRGAPRATVTKLALTELRRCNSNIHALDALLSSDDRPPGALDARKLLEELDATQERLQEVRQAVLKQLPKQPASGKEASPAAPVRSTRAQGIPDNAGVLQGTLPNRIHTRKLVNAAILAEDG